ncbi:MAG TPA: hypothetical protein VHQ65_11025 [Thermoanaerobaculia bacterium]|nr:hypothetical protein [Thermoanaerobaculia bacterium]
MSRALSTWVVLAFSVPLPAAAVPAVNVQAGRLQEVAVSFAARPEEPIRLEARVEIDPEHQGAVDTLRVLPGYFWLRPATPPTLRLEIEPDACCPFETLRATLWLRRVEPEPSQEWLPVPLTFPVRRSRFVCWASWGVALLLGGFVGYAGLSWVGNTRLLRRGVKIQRLPRNRPDTVLMQQLDALLRPRQRLRAWWRARAWWSCLKGEPYRETVELRPSRRGASLRLVSPREMDDHNALYLRAAAKPFDRPEIVKLRDRPGGFEVRARTASVTTLLDDEAEGWSIAAGLRGGGSRR